LTPQKYLDSFHGGNMTHMHNAMMDKGVTLSYPMLRRNIKGICMPTIPVWEAWEDFTKGKVDREELIQVHLLYIDGMVGK